MPFDFKSSEVDANTRSRAGKELTPADFLSGHITESTKASVFRKHRYLKKPEGSQVGPAKMDKVMVAQSVDARRQRIHGERVLEDEKTSTQNRSKRLRADSNICNLCSHLDLLGALQKATRIRESESDPYGTDLHHGILIAYVGHRFRQRWSTDCALCSILFDSRVCPDKSSTSSNNGDEIRLFGFLDHSPYLEHSFGFREYDSEFLAVVRSDSNRWDHSRLQDHVRHEGAAILYRAGDRPAMFCAKEVPDVFDVTTVNTWMDYCKHNHSTSCGSSKSDLLPGLRLIDCEKRSVIEVESNKPYVAFSYVWGKTCGVDSALRRTRNRLVLPASPSAVISDAIRVTKALGFQYLWVDRFCIDQNNPDSKHQQIQQMDAIYENAELTIVAAAGADETYGLPGVGQRPRKSQKTATFNGLQLISTMKDPHLSIRTSRWASRGWTFQEAILSRRRLVFTDEQLYFECNTMSCSESMCSQLDKLHQEDNSSPLHGSRAGMFNKFKPGMRAEMSTLNFLTPGLEYSSENFWKPITYEQTNFETFSAYLSSIAEYSSRELSYDSDSLNAFQGIIQRYSKLSRPFNAIWGMPYSAQLEDRIRCFCFALSWSHGHECFRVSKPPRRRPEFPSWTWAGWNGGIHDYFPPSMTDFNRFKVAIQSIRFGHREKEREVDLECLDSTASESECRVLRLLARILPPNESWKRVGNEGFSWYIEDLVATLFPSENCMLEACFVQEFMDGEKWRFIWVCSTRLQSSVVVLKRKHNTDVWERAGMFEILCPERRMLLLTASTEPTWSSIE